MTMCRSPSLGPSWRCVPPCETGCLGSWASHCLHSVVSTDADNRKPRCPGRAYRNSSQAFPALSHLPARSLSISSKKTPLKRTLSPPLHPPYLLQYLPGLLPSTLEMHSSLLFHTAWLSKSLQKLFLVNLIPGEFVLLRDSVCLRQRDLPCAGLLFKSLQPFKAGPDAAQQPHAPSGSPMWWQGPKCLGYLLLPSRVHGSLLNL